MTTVLDQSETPLSPSIDIRQHWLSSYVLNWEVLLYISIFILAVFTRFYALGDRAMSHDESLHTRYSYNLAQDGDYVHTPLMHGPVLFHFTALFYTLFGDSDFTSRLYPAILGVLTVMFPILFRRWLGRWGAIVTSLMLLISPITLYYHRYIRHDTPSIFFALVMVYCIMMYLSGPKSQRRRPHWLYILVSAMLLNLGSKETAFIYIFIFGTYLALFWFVRLIDHLIVSIPTKTVFYTLVASFCVGGMAALAMIATISITLGNPSGTGSLMEQLRASQTMTDFISWSLIIAVFMFIFVGTAAFIGTYRSQFRIDLFQGVIFIALSIVISIIFTFVEVISHIPTESGHITDEPAAINPEAPTSTLMSMASNFAPFIVMWIITLVILAALYLIRFRFTSIWATMRKMPEFDLIVIIGTLILPWAAPFVVVLSGASPTDYSPQGIIRTAYALIPMFAISLSIGLLWNWRIWPTCLLIFYTLFVFFFTTALTNSNGLATGLIGSLGYWLEQQGVRRGSQPQYYYVGIQLPLYEYLPLFGSILAAYVGLIKFWQFRARQTLLRHRHRVDLHTPNQSDTLTYLPFIPFVAWWGILTLIAYTLAGEKMPWLTTHLVLPMIFLSGWFLGTIIEQLDWSKFLRTGWLYLLCFPLIFILMARGIAPFIFDDPNNPLTAAQLSSTGRQIAIYALLFTLFAYGIYQIRQMRQLAYLGRMALLSFATLLAVLTIRTAWTATFINYDLVNEFLVYAHSAPAVKEVLSDIEELSQRTTDGRNLQFIYDNEVSWPYSWYFRDFPNAVFVGENANANQVDQATVVVIGEANRSKFEPLVEDRFYHYEYIRLWWPMQDYFHLNPTKVYDILGWSNSGINSAALRRGLWDIWWARDYTQYANVTGNASLAQLSDWPVRDKMHVYIRKDFSTQIWDLGVGDGEPKNPLADVQVNVCNTNWQTVFAHTVYESPDLANPIDVTVDDDGNVYVAQEGSAQITVFNDAGDPINTFGEAGFTYIDGSFLGHDVTLGILQRPNGLAVDHRGNIYVADTWNYRVQVFDPDGIPQTAWGTRGEYGSNALTEPEDGLWGPRDVLVSPSRQVFVSDTGNKRIRVYDSEGTFIRDIGKGGSGNGELNEPAGLALHSDGRLFIADTWNRRVTVFQVDGTFEYTFSVRGWYNDQGNRPYLGLDEDRDLIYITDPDAGRVLVYNMLGECQGSFGQAASGGSASGRHEFLVAAGVAVDAEGQVYIADSRANRILQFDPFDYPVDDNPVDDTLE